MLILRRGVVRRRVLLAHARGPRGAPARGARGRAPAHRQQRGTALPARLTRRTLVPQLVLDTRTIHTSVTVVRRVVGDGGEKSEKKIIDVMTRSLPDFGGLWEMNVK